MGFYWSYTLLLKSTVLMRSCYSHDNLCDGIECQKNFFHFLQLIVYGMLVMIFGGVFPCAIFVCVQPILRRRSLFSSAAAGYGPLQEVSPSPKLDCDCPV